MNSPLEGVRVVDFTTTIAGPHCTRLLADCGAEIIKLEAQAQKDNLRAVILTDFIRKSDLPRTAPSRRAR